MKRKLIVVDVETAGLDASQHSILSFAAVIYQDGFISGEFMTLVQEPTFCLQEPHDIGGGKIGTALDVNGLTTEDIATAPSPWLAVQQFVNWLGRNEVYGRQTLVAHNAAFDVSFLRRLWRLAGADFDKQFEYRTLCTQTAALLLEQAGRIQLPGGSASLDNVAAVFGLKRETKHHDSLGDARLCAKVLAKMIERIR